MVLDGAIDPTISDAESLMGQVIGFDSAFRAYLEDCLTRLNCPFVGDVDSAVEVVANFLQERESSALPTQLDRDLSLSATLTGIIAALYSKDSWIYLTQAFVEALDGDGTTMLMLADFYHDRDIAEGYLSNQNEANLAIGCADGRIEAEEVAELNERFVEASAVFGKYFQHPDLACENWPRAKSVVELDFTIALANPPLVVGTTGDPATPYAQAVALSELLDGATLLTLEGEGHTAYGQNICIDAIVEAYFRGEDIGEGNKTCVG
jgi:pimeloyl-ACP methyl ester carboxylesterase